MSKLGFGKGLVAGIALAALVVYFYDKNRNKIALPKTIDITPENSNVIETSTASPQANNQFEKPIEEYVLYNQFSKDLLEFEENCNEIADAKFFDRQGYADDSFFRVAQNFEKNTKGVFLKNKVSKKFVQDFNIFYNRIKGNRDFRKTDFRKNEKSEVIKIGERSTEANMFIDVVNKLHSKANLRADSNYTKKMHSFSKDLLSGTSVYIENEEGAISKEFIRNIYNLITNLKK